jgi:hypothetical protein
MGAVDDAKKYLSLRPPMENKTIFALHPDVLVAGLLDEIERLREENQRQKEKIMLLNSMVQTEHEIIRVATRKEGE